MRTIGHCPVCNSSDFQALFQGHDLQTAEPDLFDCRRCRACQSLFLSPQLEPEDLARFYPSRAYYSLRGAKLGWGSATRALLRRVRRLGGAAWVLKWALFPIYDFMRFSNIPKDKRFMDMGCGQGQFLIEMLGIGVKGQGVEPAKHDGGLARDLGITIRQAQWPAELLGQERFDVVTLNHVLEHSGEPERLLREVHTVLDQDGLLVLGVPVVDGLAWSVFGKNWHQLDLPRHQVIFSKKGLCRLLDRCGFTIVHSKCNSRPNPLVLSCSTSLGLLRPARVTVYLLSVIFLPVSFVLNRLGLGDQIEVVCRRRHEGD